MGNMFKNGINQGVVVILVLLLFFGITAFGLFHYKVFAPKFENIRREVFENTRSYNQAKLQELAKYRLEYLRSKDKAEQEAIASTIRHRFADYNKNKLPYELKMFLTEINQ